MSNLENARDLGQGIYTKIEVDTIESNLQSTINAIPKTISKTSSNVLLNQSALALDNFAVTKNFATVTYTGNGTTQSITTGISSVDFTVASNGSGYYHDRTAGDCIVKNDAGTIVESGSCVVNVSKVHIKCRSVAGTWNTVVDGIRGDGLRIFTNETNAEAGSDGTVDSFTSTGFTLTGSAAGGNQSSATYVAYQTLYTHIRWGLTNQNKRYIEAYNPITGDTMIMYEGSGIGGHQIPHSLGREVDFATFKILTTSADWLVKSTIIPDNYYMLLNSTTASNQSSSAVWEVNDTAIVLSTNEWLHNNGSNTYILYGKAKSQNWTIVQYQGTGASGNFVETKDVNGVARRPRRVIIKRTDSTGHWYAFDTERGDGWFNLNGSNSEVISDLIDININGITVKSTSPELNASGGQYIALVEFDTNGDGGDGYFNYPTDDSVLNVTSGKFLSTNGLNDSGYDVALETVTGSIDFSTATDGINYVAKELGGGYQFYTKRPMNGLYTKESADDNRLIFDKETGKYYTTTGGELVTNGTFDVQADVDAFTSQNGATLTLENGTMKIDRGTAGLSATYNISTTVGAKYKLEAYLSNISNTAEIRVSNGSTGNVTTDGKIIIDFIAENSNEVVSMYVWGANTDYFNIDNISVYKVEPTLNTPLTTPISFLPYPWMVASGTPQYEVIDIEPLADVVANNVEFGNVVANNVEFNQVRAEEYKGKNACTAWVNFDGTTTPPTIRDSYNVSSVIRTSTGIYHIYLEDEMDNTDYTCNVSIYGSWSVYPFVYGKYKNKVHIEAISNSGVNYDRSFEVQLFGGKNND